jgi:hypothetical protein
VARNVYSKKGFGYELKFSPVSVFVTIEAGSEAPLRVRTVVLGMHLFKQLVVVLDIVAVFVTLFVLVMVLGFSPVQ